MKSRENPFELTVSGGFGGCVLISGIANLLLEGAIS